VGADRAGARAADGRGHVVGRQAAAQQRDGRPWPPERDRVAREQLGVLSEALAD
jgi:hypothetical protein